MLNWPVRLAVRLVERLLPDPYVLVLLLSLLAAAGAMLGQGQAPLDVLRIWGGGFWNLLPFSMQMLLVLVSGYLLASAPPVRAGLDRVAALARSPGSAIVLTSAVSMLAAWINWGFGLVVGALFAKAVARRVRVDYRLLIASAYSAFIVWHAGLSGSIPLTIATDGHFMAEAMGVVPPSQTIFAPFNLAILFVLVVLIPVLNRLMLPPPEESVHAEPAALGETPAAPAEGRGIEHRAWLSAIVGLAGLAYLADYFIGGGGLNLNIVNFAFLFLAVLLHRTPRRLLDSLQQAIQGGAGIVIQFPFYAGIMAIMTETGLAASLSQGFVSLASAGTLPFWSFLSAGLVNFFVPSGGGQWAVQAPVMIPAAQALGAELPRVAMAVAWGDAWTNLLQPFWALPALAIAGLRAKDIMGFCLIQLLVTGGVIALGLTFL